MNETDVRQLAPSRFCLTGFLAPQGGRAPDPDDRDSNDGELAAGSDSQAEDAGTNEKIEVALDHSEKKHVGWKRVPQGSARVRVPLDEKALAKRDGIPIPGSRGLLLRGELRTTEMDGLEPGTRVLSLFLVNDRAPMERDRDTQFVFQVKMALSFAAGFRCRPNRRGEDGSDDDQRVLALAFRDRIEWAVGHNTSVEHPKATDGLVTTLRTTQLPSFEVPRVDHRALDEVTSGMADLARLDGHGLVNALSPIAEEYRKWIERQRAVPLARDALEHKRELERGATPA